MTDAVLISVVTGVVTLATQILTMVAAQRARAAAEEAKQQTLVNSSSIDDNTKLTKEVHEKVEKVAIEIDGKMADILKLTGESERAKGVKEGNEAGLIQGNKEGVAQAQLQHKEDNKGNTPVVGGPMTGTIKGDITINQKK